MRTTRTTTTNGTRVYVIRIVDCDDGEVFTVARLTKGGAIESVREVLANAQFPEDERDELLDDLQELDRHGEGLSARHEHMEITIDCTEAF